MVTHNTDTWIVHHKPNSQAKLRLFCFPYAGSNASIYRTWASHLPADVDVCPIQLPGRGSRFKEPPFTHLSPLIQTLIRVLTPYLDIPFAFFGHSMGALISFELARECRRRHITGLQHLFVSGRGAPHLPDPNPHLAQLPDTEFIEKLRHYKGTPENVLQSEELMALFFPILRADFAVCETYVYWEGAPLSCPITAFGGFQDQTVRTDTVLAWRRQTETIFKHYLFPGDHFFLHSNQEALWQSLAQELEQVIHTLVAWPNPDSYKERDDAWSRPN